VPASPYGNANVVSLLAASTDGSNTIGNISATGNIAGTYFLGDGSQLTGLPATYSNANVATFLAAFGSNTIVTTGNITGGYIFGNGSQLTGLPATYGNANVATLLAGFGSNTIVTTGNITGGNLFGNGAGITGITVAAGTQIINGTSNVSVALNGNTTIGVASVTQAEISSQGISAVGNITGSYFLGNGSQLTGLPATYGNANVAANLAAFANNPISTTGNITGGNILGGANVNATTHTGTTLSVTANITGGNVLTSGLISAGGNITGGNLILQSGGEVVGSNQTRLNYSGATGRLQILGGSGSGSISQSSLYTGEVRSYGNVFAENGFVSAIGNVRGGNIDTAGQVSATGNITGNYFIGNGSQLTGITAVSTYGDSNVATFLAAFGSNAISTTGNITGNYFLGNGSALTGITATAANSAVFLRDASNAAAYVSLDDSSKIVVLPGGGSLYYGGDGVDPNSFGSVDILNPQTSIANSYVGMTWANAANLAADPLNTMVITGFGASFIYDAAGQHGGTQSFGVSGSGVTTNTTLSATGNITAPYFIGNGSALTGITTTYGDSNVTTLLAGFGSNTISTTGNITGGNLSVTNIAGTLTTATQTNITSLGTLNSLVVTANIDGGNLRTVGQVSAGGNITGSFFLGNGSQLTGIASSYGNANVAANLAAFANNPISTTGNITAGNLNTGGLVSATGTVFAGNVTTTGVNGNIAGVNYITANYFVGNGSLLTSVAASTSIVNGTSNVAIGASGGNANVSIGGTSNVAVFATTGLTVTGNITGGNLTGVSSSVATGIINYKDYVATITYGATITPDIALGSIQQVTLTGNVTMNAFGGTPQAGQSMVIKFIQDGTGGRILSSTMKWAGAAKTLSTAPNAVDIASVFYDGTTYWASLTLAYA
jgi:hypothetical protein